MRLNLSIELDADIETDFGVSATVTWNLNSGFTDSSQFCTEDEASVKS